ncbi:MAG: TrkH family potassium uptake protein [Oscillospiraceae bacterium]|nr:TrkH family potassium uptake protein [Oscillospiraceae bacterium]
MPKLFVLMGLLLLFPVLMVIPNPADAKYLHCFLVPAVFSAAFGLALGLISARLGTGKKPITLQRDSLIVVAVWFYAFVLGAVPFYLSGMLDWLQSIFESVSGWTTSGFTVVKVEEVPKIFLFYRSFMQFCGGLGFVLLMLLIASGADAMRLFSAEGHPDKLEANLRGTARLMMLIYLGLFVGGSLLYMCFGMGWFDAVNHCMSAIATGGFSTHSDSIGYFNSLPIEIITVALMLLGATNFAVFALLIKRKFRAARRVGELRFFGVFLTIAVLALAVLGLGGVYASFGKSLRVTLFQAVSGVTTTGLSVDSLTGWRPDMTLIMILLMIIGGGSGSTAGGLKYSRVYILSVSFINTLRRKFLPERAVYVTTVHTARGPKSLGDRQLLAVHHFALIYLVTLFAGTLLLTFNGVPLQTALFDFASSLSTTGYTDGLTSIGADHYILTVQIIGMILARLEIYIIYVALAAGVRGAHRAIKQG